MSRKSQYRIKNWTEYNRSLINRGNITLWFSEEMVRQWNDDQRTGKRGRPRIYRDQFILAMLTLRQLFSLQLRATQGLVEGICHQMGLNADPEPHDSTWNAKIIQIMKTAAPYGSGRLDFELFNSADGRIQGAEIMRKFNKETSARSTIQNFV